MENVGFTIIFGSVFGLIIGRLAKRKNRNGWLWGITFGGIIVLGQLIGYINYMNRGDVRVTTFTTGGGFWIWIIGMISLAFMSHLCPKCKGKLNKEQWKAKNCPRCGV
ncbi:MAG: hypothetical protein Q8N12_07735 [Thermodesulfovibrionales bacterium]|nr:hypothetical protein [Thermodesulfovibrionales bacterium]MDP3049300.1 hypothetical protein [Thermodesulfovibrionales bacterium]